MDKEKRMNNKDKKPGLEQQEKKLKFGRIWRRIWLPILGAVMVCLIVGSALACRYQDSYEVKDFENMSLHWTDCIWELQEKYAAYVDDEVAFQDTMAELQVYADGLYNTYYDAYVIDEQGNIVLEGSETVYLGCFDSVEGEFVMFRCGDEEMTQQILEAVKKYTEKYSQLYVDVRMDELYIDGNECYPVKVNIYIETEENGNTEYQLEETIVGNYNYTDLSPEAVLYEGLDKGTEESYIGHLSISIVLTYYDRLNAGIPQVREEAEEQLLSWARDDVYWGSHVELDIVGKDGRKYLVSMIPITLEEGTYYLVFSTTYQPFMTILEDLILVWALGIFGSLILSWAIAMGFAHTLRKEQELVRRQQAYTNALAHDLKTPLMAISGYTENLEAGVNPEKQAHYFQSIHANIDYMNQMVGNMLELAKVAHGTEISCEESIELRPMVEQILQDYEQKMQEKKLNVQMDGAATIKGNSLMIQRLFQNLIDNAVKFSPEGETIQVVLSETKITVTNTGVTVPKEDWERVFEPFVKGDEVRKKQDGTGLGLSIVKDIAQLHGFQCSMECADEATTITIKRQSIAD